MKPSIQCRTTKAKPSERVAEPIPSKAKFDRNAYQREYMRQYRAKKKAVSAAT